METIMADVVVVFAQREYYVQASVEADNTLNLDVFQCQLLSLLGLLPEEQILSNDRGEIISSPVHSVELKTLPVPPNRASLRVFVTSLSESLANTARVPPDASEICTRSAFGDSPVIQPGFWALGGDPDTVVCEPCAKTCSDNNAQPVTPYEWQSSQALRNRFISELRVVAGEVDVVAPPGFDRIAGDLNYSASGDYVHLFVKRGGMRVVTHVTITQQPREGDSVKSSSPDINSGNASSTSIFLDYETTSASAIDASSVYGVTDLLLLAGSETAPPGFIRIPSNLNEGVADEAAKPLCLCYRLAPLRGFACAAKHGVFGECLFESRHLPVSLRSVVASGSSPQEDAVLQTLQDSRQRSDESFLHAHYRQHEPAMLSRLQSGMDRVRTYEDPRMQAEALKRIPVEKLHERARANPTPLPSYQDELVMQLTHWFKREFFSWMNQPVCSVCSHAKTQIVRTEGPSTVEEKAGHAGRVEVYQCPQCRGFTRFPRYNDPVKLLDTRTGRCGEWANCFTLCCRAMGFEARYVLDVTDHVWTEVYSAHHQRWLHCDACEDQLDCPLTYEVGWGKKLSYIFSFAHDHVVDTARRYTQSWDEMQTRRTDVGEAWLVRAIDERNQQHKRSMTTERRAILEAREIQERRELEAGKQASAAEVQGRVSGSDEWKSQRREDGGCDPATSGSQVLKTEATRMRLELTNAELAQAMVKAMLLGCDRRSACTNPRCAFNRSTQVDGTPTERAAIAIREVAQLQSLQLSQCGMVSLLCPLPGSVEDYLLSHKPLLYLPMQDSESNLLVDASGNGHHIASQLPRRKPFRIASTNGKEILTAGVQLLPSTSVTLPSLAADRDGWMLSMLVRFEGEITSETSSVLSIRVGEQVTVAMQPSPATRDQLEVTVATPTGTHRSSSPSTALRIGLYYHLLVQFDRTSDEFAVSVNATTAIKVQQVASFISTASTALSLENPTPERDLQSIVPVVSHVAVMAFSHSVTSQVFADTMKQRYVCWPPLQAFSAAGIAPTKTCDVQEATLQSGYHVARVRMWGGEFFDGIQLVYEKELEDGTKTVVLGPLVGNRKAQEAAHSPTIEATLESDEFITKISGRKGAWTDCLRIETNFGRRFECGGSGGGEFQVTTPSSVQIRAIAFDVGDHLVDAVAFVAEAPAPESHEQFRELMRIFKDVDSKPSAIAAVLRYLDNIVASPSDPKFQKIKASNKFFATSVGALDPPSVQVEFMKWCGFSPVQEAGDTFFAFNGTCEASLAATRRVYLLRTYTARK